MIGKRPCIYCGKSIDPEKEDYIVGESLGEYWCLPCASAQQEEEKMDKIDIKKASVNIQLTIDGDIYLVDMDVSTLNAITILVKAGATAVTPTGKTLSDLVWFLCRNPKEA